MLTSTEQKYLAICTEKANTQDRNTDIARRLNTPIRTVDRAIAWGRKKGFFVRDNRRKLSRYIAEHQKHLDWLEKELKESKRFYRNRGTPLPSRQINALSREIRAVRTRLMELEGLYRQTVNVDVSGEIKSAVQIYLPDNGRDGTSIN